MTDPVRLGIIGTSWYADELLPALCAHPRAAVVALCGRNQERAGEMARKYGIPRVFADYRQMYEQAELDAVVVVAPDDLHYPMTMDALDRGLHVLCEKALALTLADARAMLAKAQDANVKHMVNFTWRALPAYQYMKELIGDGYIGRASQCTFSFTGGFGRDGAYAWRFDRRRATGMLGDLGSHMADLARWLVGDIASVYALLDAFVPRPGPEGGTLAPANDAATLALRFANGAQGTIGASAVAHLGDRFLQQQVVIYGAEGTLEATLLFNRGWELYGARAGEPEIRPLPIPERIIGQVDHTQPLMDQFGHRLLTQSLGPRAFIDAILEDRPATPSFADGVAAQAVIEAALRSQETGCAVAIQNVLSS